MRSLGNSALRGIPRWLVLLVALCWLANAPCAQAQVSSSALSLNATLTSANPLTLWSQMTPGERQSLGDGAAIGALAGAFISAYPAMSEGAGGNLGGDSLGFIGAGLLVGAVLGGTLGYLAERRWPTPFEATTCSGYSLLNPCAGQFDFQIGSLLGFTGPGSLVRVREFETEGTGLQFGDMGIHSQQMPTLDLHYWFNRLDTLHFRFRYFNMGGSSFSSTPIVYNGAIIPGGRTNNFDPWEWFSFGLYYEHRLTRLYEKYESNWAPPLQHWDLRLRMGIEYTYLYYEINGGHTTKPKLAPGGEETAEDFYHQSMPLPTIGLEAYRSLPENLLFEAEVEGNWINRWNSLREEGGRIWASQNGAEAHLRLFYSNPRLLRSLEPMVGFFFYYYSQLEDSHEDGNFIRWSSYGPEVGISYSF